MRTATGREPRLGEDAGLVLHDGEEHPRRACRRPASLGYAFQNGKLGRSQIGSFVLFIEVEHQDPVAGVPVVDGARSASFSPSRSVPPAFPKSARMPDQIARVRMLRQMGLKRLVRVVVHCFGLLGSENAGRKDNHTAILYASGVWQTAKCFVLADSKFSPRWRFPLPSRRTRRRAARMGRGGRLLQHRGVR